MNHRNNIATFLFGLFIFAAAGPTFAAEYYFSPSGNDSNPGTLAAPWKTYFKLYAIQGSLRPGDTVWFRGGDYIIDDSGGRYYYPLTADGTASAPISYKNYPGERPVFVFDKRNVPPDASDKAWGMIFYVSGDYTIFDGLHLRQTEQTRRLATTNNDAYHDRNAMVRGMAIWSNNVIVRNCSLDNLSGLGIASPGSNILVENCRFTNGGNHYLYLQGPNGTFRYNYMDGSRQTNGGRPVQIQYLKTKNNKVYGNLIINGSADAVVFSGQTSANKVFNNVIINGGSGRNSGYALGTWCEDGPMGPGNEFYNNTLIGRSVAGLIGDPLTGKCAGVRPVSRIQIYDNIFYPSPAVRVGLTQNYPNIRNNIFYNIIGSVPPGNTLIDPKLVNPNGNMPGDAALQTDSPARDAGTGSAFPPDDFEGKSRPAGASYDIGALEGGYEGLRPIAPPPIGVPPAVARPPSTYDPGASLCPR